MTRSSHDHFSPVIHTIRAVIRWAAHYWDADRWPAEFRYVFKEVHFRRWITAFDLCKRIPPAFTVTTGAAR